MAEKRKTHTSNAVKKRFIDKAYKRFTVSLRHDTDAEIIEKIEALQEQGLGNTEIFRELLKSN